VIGMCNSKLWGRLALNVDNTTQLTRRSGGNKSSKGRKSASMCKLESSRMGLSIGAAMFCDIEL
jgi:hypothetical protein